MTDRREMIRQGMLAAAGLWVLPDIHAFADKDRQYKSPQHLPRSFRMAFASDIHYGQANTGFAEHTENLIRWLNADHAKNHLDLVIINGDLVHNRPDLLPEIKTKYLDRLTMPYYTIPGNHDYADADTWQKVFGYADKYCIDREQAVFVLANTADTKGDYICPDIAFLKKSLDTYRDRKTVFVVLHIPPLNWIKEDAFTDCPGVVNLLHQYPNVKAAFHGHDHLLDGVRYTGKLPHFFDAHIGGDWGTVYRGYRIVEISEEDHINTYQVNASADPVINRTGIGG